MVKLENSGRETEHPLNTIHVGDPTIAWESLRPQADAKRVVLTQAGIDRDAGTPLTFIR